MIKVLISATFLFFFLLPSSFSGPPRSSFNFINVYMKSYDIATPNSTLHSYLWGASGQIAFFLDKRTFPVEQILIKIKQANSSALSKEDLDRLSNFGRIIKNVENEIVFSISPFQIAASDFNQKLCGLFIDEEYTFDIDIPIYRKDRKDGERLFFMFLFDLKDQENLTRIYNKLNEICLKSIEKDSFVELE